MSPAKAISWRHRCEYYFTVWLTRLLSHFSLYRRHRLADLLGLVWYYLLPFRHKVVRRNLTNAFPEMTERWRRRIMRRCYQHVCGIYFDLLPFYYCSNAQFAQLVRVAGAEFIKSALAEKRGALVVLYHFGNWEICADWLARQGYRIAAVAKRQKNPLVDRLLFQARTYNGVEIFNKNRRNAWQLKQFLQQGGMLYLLADQDARRSGIFVNFFGQPASTHRGPALFALQGNVPIITGCCLWTGRDYQIEWERCTFKSLSKEREQAVLEITQRLASHYEALIRRYPEQYYWLHRRWKTRPTQEVHHAIS